MTSPDLDTFLPAAFRAFLYDTRRVEGEIRRLLARAAEGEDVRRPPDDEIRRQLADLLARQQTDAQAQGRDPAAATFQQGQHLMAAVADAILQAFEWWGRQAWLKEPLARDFPPPDGVAPEIPEQVAELAAAEDPDPELAQLYLLALATGARLGDAGFDTASHRRRLFTLLGDRFPELANEPPRAFPEAYRRRQRRGPAALLPPVRTWLAAALVVGGLLLLVSAPLWLEVTAAARQAVTQILTGE